MGYNVFKPKHPRKVSTRIRWLSEEDTIALVKIWQRVGSNDFRALDIDDIFPGFKNSTRHLKFNRVLVPKGRGVWQISDNIRARFEASYGNDAV